MYDYEQVYETLTGMMDEEMAVPGVEDITQKGFLYERAYQRIYEARLRLCERFDIPFKDRDLERIMVAILDIEEDIARYMYHYGALFAEKE